MAQIFRRLFCIALDVLNDYGRQLLDAFWAYGVVLAFQVVVVDIFYFFDVIAFGLFFQSETLTAPHVDSIK